MSETLLIDESRAHVCRLTLNRPEKRNALNLELMEAIAAAFEEITRRQQSRVVVLRGAGPVFCAGLDLSQAHDPQMAEPCAKAVVRMLGAVFECPALTIAQVQGHAVAGGAGLMSACDLVVASEETRFGYPEIKRGLVAASVMALLRRQIRERDARELLVLGELISAEKACQIGLINRVVSRERLEEETERLVQCSLQGAPGAIADTKRLLNQLWPCSLDKDFDATLMAYLSARDSEEAQEGIRAFLEKRPPKWAEKNE